MSFSSINIDISRCSNCRFVTNQKPFLHKFREIVLKKPNKNLIRVILPRKLHILKAVTIQLSNKVSRLKFHGCLIIINVLINMGVFKELKFMNKLKVKSWRVVPSFLREEPRFYNVLRARPQLKLLVDFVILAKFVNYTWGIKVAIYYLFDFQIRFSGIY